MKLPLTPRRAMQLKALLALGCVVGLGTVSTLAAWTGTATATAQISAGTVSLAVGPNDAGAVVDYTIPLTASNWYPGMSQAYPLVVKNTGTFNAPYTLSGSITETGSGQLGNALNVKLTTGSPTGTSPSATCSGSPSVIEKLAAQAFPAAVAQPSLTAGSSQTLCVQVTLPAGSSATLQGNSTKITLTFVSSVGS